MKKLLYLGFFFFIIFLNNLCAEPLTLKDLVKSSIEKNLDIQAEEITIKESEELTTVAKSKYEPQIEINLRTIDRNIPSSTAFSSDDSDIYREIGADVSLSKMFSSGLKSTVKLETDKSMNNSSVDSLRPHYNTLLRFDITQPLFKNYGALINNKDIEISKKVVLQAIKNYEKQIESISYETEALYWELYQSLEILKLSYFSKELTIKLLKANQDKFNAGIIPITEAQQSETALAGKEEDIIKAKEAIDILQNKIKDITGITSSINIIEEPDYYSKTRIFNENEGIDIALSKRPEIDIQKTAIEITEIDENYYKNQTRPSVDLLASASFSGLSGEERKTEFFPDFSNPNKGGYFDSVSGAATGDGKELFAGIKFSHPLDNKGARANLKKTQWTKEKNQLKLIRLREKITLDVKNALVTINKTKERIETSMEFVRLAQITLDQEMERFSAGLSDTFHILRYQEDLVNAKIKLTVANFDYYKAMANFYFVTSQNLDNMDIRVGYKAQ